jgi:hypothetical protein
LGTIKFGSGVLEEVEARRKEMRDDSGSSSSIRGHSRDDQVKHDLGRVGEPLTRPAFVRARSSHAAAEEEKEEEVVAKYEREKKKEVEELRRFREEMVTSVEEEKRRIGEEARREYEEEVISKDTLQ